jgi:hypothetical protein
MIDAVGRWPNIPRGFVTIETASDSLTHGGTPRALAAAATFLRMVADSQGLTVAQATGMHLAVKNDVRLRWFQVAPAAPLYVHREDINALREPFGMWIADVVPLSERTEMTGTGGTSGAAAAAKKRKRMISDTLGKFEKDGIRKGTWKSICDEIRDVCNGWKDKRKGLVAPGFDDRTIKRIAGLK